MKKTTLKCLVDDCGRVIKGGQGAMMHLRYMHGVGLDEGYNQHRDKFEVLSVTEVPDSHSKRRKSLAPAVIPHPTTFTPTRVRDDDAIVVVKNMEVVRRGDQIGIVEWYDHGS